MVGFGGFDRDGERFDAGIGDGGGGWAVGLVVGFGRFGGGGDGFDAGIGDGGGGWALGLGVDYGSLFGGVVLGVGCGYFLSVFFGVVVEVSG